MPLVFISTRWLPHQQMDSEDFNFVVFFPFPLFSQTGFWGQRKASIQEAVRVIAVAVVLVAGSSLCVSMCVCAHARRACCSSRWVHLIERRAPVWKLPKSVSPHKSSSKKFGRTRAGGWLIYLFIIFISLHQYPEAVTHNPPRLT